MEKGYTVKDIKETLFLATHLAENKCKKIPETPSCWGATGEYSHNTPQYLSAESAFQALYAVITDAGLEDEYAEWLGKDEEYTMHTEYIADLRQRAACNEPINEGEKILLKAANYAAHFHHEQFSYRGEINLSAVPDLLIALRNAEINDFYLTKLGNSDDELEAIWLMDHQGLRLREVTFLDNPQYVSEVKEWGESWQKQTIPALRFSFKETDYEKPDY